MCQRLLQWILLHGVSAWVIGTDPPPDPDGGGSGGGGNILDSYHNPLPTSYDGPISITQGGIYTGNWESTDPSVDAVAVRTTQPVMILNSNVKSAGYGIVSRVDGTNITVLNTRHRGGAVSYRQRRFVISERFKNLVIENCEMENSAGIYTAGRYMGNGTANETVVVRYNRAINIDSRVSNAEGWLRSQFFQMNGVTEGSIYFNDGTYDYIQGIPHVQVGFNYVFNQPGKSWVEDNVNIYNSRGTIASPMKLYNNFIHGAYYWNWQGEDFHGSGMIADSPGAHRGRCSAFLEFAKNTVMMSNAATFGIAGGNNIDFIDNVGIGKGYIDEEEATRLGLPTGFNLQTELRGYPGSVYMTDERYGMNATYSNRLIRHTDGVMGGRCISGNNVWRNDFSGRSYINPAWGTITDMNVLPGVITRATEDFYRQEWENQVAAANVTIGVFVKN